MQVESVYELTQENPVRQTRDGTTYTRVWQVELDSRSPAYLAPILAMTASTIPDMGDAHPYNADATVKSIEPDCVNKEGVIWRVVVNYDDVSQSSSTNRDSEPNQDNSNPFDDDPRIAWSSRTDEEVLEREPGTGDAVVNSSNELFDPPLMKPKRTLILTVVKNQAGYTPATAYNYMDSVNDSSITIAGLPIPRRCAKLESLDGQKLSRNGIVYYRNTFVLAMRAVQYVRGNKVIASGYTAAGYDTESAGGWDRVVLDRGKTYLDAYGLEVTATTEGDGEIKGEVNLDGEGGLLASGADIVFLAYRGYTEQSFSTLGLPETF